MKNTRLGARRKSLLKVKKAHREIKSKQDWAIGGELMTLLKTLKLYISGILFKGTMTQEYLDIAFRYSSI